MAVTRLGKDCKHNVNIPYARKVSLCSTLYSENKVTSFQYATVSSINVLNNNKQKKKKKKKKKKKNQNRLHFFQLKNLCRANILQVVMVL